MPVYNEARFIERSLGAVLQQDYAPDRMEVIVVDGMSTDGTRRIVTSLQSRYPGLRLIDNPRGIVASGLNIGILQAQGEIIVRVDGHCEIATDYVSKCVQHLVQDDVDGVGGPIDTVGETSWARVIALAMSSRFGVGGSAFRTIKDRRMLVDTVAFPAYTKQVIERAGLFDEELVRNQDDEYNYRLRKLGGRLLLAPDVRSRYYSRSSLQSLWSQYLQYGYWKVRVMQKHPRQMSLRQFVPPLFVCSLLIALAVASFSGVGKWMFGAISVCYLSASFMISAQIATTGFSILALPATFGALHIAYGLGFLAGLVRFWNRWGQSRRLSNCAFAGHDAQGQCRRSG